MRLAAKLCGAIADVDFGIAGRITCSAGVTAIRADDRVADLILRADTALYRAKRNGRNRVGQYADVTL